MRPGEIRALQWKHVADDYVDVMQRLYRGKLDRPKTERSTRQVALSTRTRELVKRWQRKQKAEPEAWVFPTAKTRGPLRRDNAWRQFIQPRLNTVGLDWATFQIMRRTHASLSREAGIDPKLVADQLGHGLGVNLDVYTVAALEKRQHAVEALETSVVKRAEAFRWFSIGSRNKRRERQQFAVRVQHNRSRHFPKWCTKWIAKHH
jgi:integrase